MCTNYQNRSKRGGVREAYALGAKKKNCILCQKLQRSMLYISFTKTSTSIILVKNNN
jgi:hypothetical protein